MHIYNALKDYEARNLSTKLSTTPSLSIHRKKSTLDDSKSFHFAVQIKSELETLFCNFRELAMHSSLSSTCLELYHSKMRATFIINLNTEAISKRRTQPERQNHGPESILISHEPILKLFIFREIFHFQNSQAISFSNYFIAPENAPAALSTNIYYFLHIHILIKIVLNGPISVGILLVDFHTDNFCVHFYYDHGY